MALRFNTFRSQRYLRSKFVEGRFLLASEATDLELELIDLLFIKTLKQRQQFCESYLCEKCFKQQEPGQLP